MESLVGRASFPAGINPPLASTDLHWLHGKKQVLFMAGRGGQVASILYCEWQGQQKTHRQGKMLLNNTRQPRLWLLTSLSCSCVGDSPFRIDSDHERKHRRREERKDMLSSDLPHPPKCRMSWAGLDRPGARPIWPGCLQPHRPRSQVPSFGINNCMLPGQVQRETSGEHQLGEGVSSRKCIQVNRKS